MVMHVIIGERVGVSIVYRARPILSLAGSWGQGVLDPCKCVRPAPNFRRARELV